ncbi:MAG TPA: hypothetical protein VF065_07925, partial [Ilumatobacter sp.]
KVRFGRGADEHRFDFTFVGFTKEPATPTSVPQAARATPPTSTTPPAAATMPAPTFTPPPPVPTESDPLTAPIPVSMADLLSELRSKDGEVRDLIARGDFAAVWVPAFRAKDLAIALEPHLAHLTAAKQDAGGPALSRVVRGAWLLDAAGDVGNRQQVEAAHATFTTAVAEVITAFQ